MSRISVTGAVVLALAALGAFACSSSAPKGEARPSAQEQSNSEQEAALARLRSRQEAACQKVGKALFACAVEDARASMTPEEFAKLDTQQLEAEYTRRFLDECLVSDMSPRQVGVYETCLENTSCDVFVPCLDQAQPQQPAPSTAPGNGAS